MSEKLTENQIFMRDMAKMFCGCSFSGYVKCEEHKDAPLPEPTFTKAEVEQLIEAIAVKVEGDKQTFMNNSSKQSNRGADAVQTALNIFDGCLDRIRSTKL